MVQTDGRTDGMNAWCGIGAKVAQLRDACGCSLSDAQLEVVLHATVCRHEAWAHGYWRIRICIKIVKKRSETDVKRPV